MHEYFDKDCHSEIAMVGYEKYMDVLVAVWLVEEVVSRKNVDQLNCL